MHHNTDHRGMTTFYSKTMLSCGRQEINCPWMKQMLHTVYPKKYAHGFVVLCFAVVMQSFIMNSHEVFIHIHQGCFAGTGAIVRLPQCQWSKLDGYGKISQCLTTTKQSKAKTTCIFLGIYCIYKESPSLMHHNTDHRGMTTFYSKIMLSCGRQEINCPWMKQMLHTGIRTLCLCLV